MAARRVAPLPMAAIDPLASAGFSRAAGAYERGRPGYAVEAIDWVAQRLALGSDATVVDLAAGTGKLTRLVRDRTGAFVIAVEPVAEMRRQLERAVPGVPVLDGVAEALPLGDGTVDAILCGEGFHWFDGDRALPELHRVVRPGGGLGLLWNLHRWDRSVPWVREIERLIAPYSDRRDRTRYASGRWREAFGRCSLFGPLERRSFAHVQRLDAEGLVAHVGSVVFIAALPDAEREAVLAAVRQAVARAGEYEVPYRTDAWWAPRRPAHPAERSARTASGSTPSE
jgi:SAM-dependent methyltransferase